MTDETAPQPAQPEPATQPPASKQPASEQPAAKTRLRDRALGFRGVVAVTLAGVLLGGLGGTAVGFALDGDHGDRPARIGGPFGDHRGPEDGFRPPGAPQGPPGTAPEEGEQPDGSGDTSGSTNG